MKILVGTPAYDKSVTTIYLGSLLRLLDYFPRASGRTSSSR